MTRFEYIQTLLDDGRPEDLEEAKQMLVDEIDETLSQAQQDQQKNEEWLHQAEAQRGDISGSPAQP